MPKANVNIAAKTQWILDSSALLALLLDEPGGGAVRARLANASVASITLGETATKLVRRFGEPNYARQALCDLGMETIPWTETLAWQGLDLSRFAWTKGLSMADRACLTAARAFGCTALTADRKWTEVARSVVPAIAVELFR